MNKITEYLIANLEIPVDKTGLSKPDYWLISSEDMTQYLDCLEAQNKKALFMPEPLYDSKIDARERAIVAATLAYLLKHFAAKGLVVDSSFYLHQIVAKIDPALVIEQMAAAHVSECSMSNVAGKEQPASSLSPQAEAARRFIVFIQSAFNRGVTADEIIGDLANNPYAWDIAAGRAAITELLTAGEIKVVEDSASPSYYVAVRHDA